MDFSKIKEQAGNFRQNPPEGTWKKIDYMLDARAGTKQSLWFRNWLSYAAGICLICGSLFFFTYKTSFQENSPVFETAGHEPVVSPIYSSQQFVELKEAYAKAGVDNVPRTKSGI